MRRLLLPVLLLCLFSPASASAASFAQATQNLTLHARPNDSGRVTGLIHALAVGRVTGNASRAGVPWVRLNFGSQRGWTPALLTTDAPRPAAYKPDCSKHRSRAYGTPDAGRQTGAVLFPAVTPNTFTWGYLYERDGANRSHRWGNCDVVRAVLAGVASYRRANPKAPPVLIGDIARRRGGDIDGHSTHENGRQVDISFPRKDRAIAGPDRVGQVDMKLSRRLVRHMLAAGADVILVGPKTDIPTGPQVQHWPKHNTHLHVIFG